MVFGDVNLAEERVTSCHGAQQRPGAGGWPTIRYFNKATGYGGAPYKRKLKHGGVCDELLQEKYMTAYIEEAAKASMEALASQDQASEL